SLDEVFRNRAAGYTWVGDTCVGRPMARWAITSAVADESWRPARLWPGATERISKPVEKRPRMLSGRAAYFAVRLCQQSDSRLAPIMPKFGARPLFPSFGDLSCDPSHRRFNLRRKPRKLGRRNPATARTPLIPRADRRLLPRTRLRVIEAQ